MRETVCIVLNEREANKERAASTLEQRLSELGITVSRLPIDKHIQQVILQRRPRVLVLDYLLGDFTTGLDIMHSLETLDAEERPAIIFLTDEPSVPVAVQAMQLGALSYLELDHPQSLTQTVELIRSSGHISDPKPAPRAFPQPKLADLISTARVTRAVFDRAAAVALRRVPIVVIEGDSGTGLSSLAHALHTERKSSSYSRIVNLRTCTDPLSQAMGIDESESQLRLGVNLSVIVDHAEEDDGELLDLVSGNTALRRALREAPDQQSFLTVCSTDPETGKSWSRLLGAEVLSLPKLSDRREDIPGLVQRFVKEAESLSNIRIKLFDPDFTGWIAQQKFAGHVRELRSLVVNTAIICARSEQTPKDVFEEHLAAVMDETPAQTNIDEFTAAAMLERSGNRYRVAAARLGCTVAALQNAIVAAGSERAHRNGSQK